MSDEISELFGPGIAETRVIRNGIDVARWPFAERTPRTGPAQLLYLGRLEYEKGIHDAIAALPRIRRTHPGTTLTVAGEGTQLDWLIEQARKHKVLKAVSFVGQLGHDALVRALHTADAAVLPSRYEPFGIVALRRRRQVFRWWSPMSAVSVRRCSTARPVCRIRRAMWPRWPPPFAPCSTTRRPLSGAPWPRASG